MFKVGQKVVFIEQFVEPARSNEIYPIVGEIYTVRETFETIRFPCIRLVEIVNPVQYYRNGDAFVWDECGWNANKFRAIDTRFGEQVCESLEVMTEPELV
jgi:hypothetical protein